MIRRFVCVCMCWVRCASIYRWPQHKSIYIFGLHFDWLRQINNFRNRKRHTEKSWTVSFLFLLARAPMVPNTAEFTRIHRLRWNTHSSLFIFASLSVDRLYKLRWIHNWLCFCVCVKGGPCSSGWRRRRWWWRRQQPLIASGQREKSSKHCWLRFSRNHTEQFDSNFGNTSTPAAEQR